MTTPLHFAYGSHAACGLSSSRTADLADVTCPDCRAAILEIANAVRRARQSRSIPWVTALPVSPPAHILEELTDEGWRRFDMHAVLDAGPGEYSVTLRVRKKVSGDKP